MFIFLEDFITRVPEHNSCRILKTMSKEKQKKHKCFKKVTGKRKRTRSIIPL